MTNNNNTHRISCLHWLFWISVRRIQPGVATSDRKLSVSAEILVSVSAEILVSATFVSFGIGRHYGFSPCQNFGSFMPISVDFSIDFFIKI
jgi:hypothetical protein